MSEGRLRDRLSSVPIPAGNKCLLIHIAEGIKLLTLPLINRYRGGDITRHLRCSNEQTRPLGALADRPIPNVDKITPNKRGTNRVHSKSRTHCSVNPSKKMLFL